MKKIIVLPVFSFILLSCPLKDDRYLHINPGLYNLSGINTEADDYNAAPPPHFYYAQHIIYSTNYGLSGSDFDIWEASIRFEIDYPGSYDGGEETVTLSEAYIINSRIGPYLDGIYNSEYTEYGPYILDTYSELFHINYQTDEVLTDPEILYLLASNRPDGGDFDIYFINQQGDELSSFCGNSDYDDYYPTYHKSTGTLYFSSNRPGNDDIFAYANPEAKPIEEFLNDAVNADALSVPPGLNTESNERCPFIAGDIMVFVSDTAGSFDIYYSIYRDGVWTAPVNMDEIYPGINTSSDEYRPSLFRAYYNDRTDDNDVLIFSSNRDGGAGGFDLYLCILPADAFE
ncbi:MAG: PD40 domain-containing protein [Spirochaetales bacterium]|nr:PD40 domain-containing protein [Spirochaetales bacterium]